MTQTAVHSLGHCIRPSPMVKDIKVYLSKSSNLQSVFDGVITAFDWMAHFGYKGKFASAMSQKLCPIKQTLSIPGFISSLGDMQEKWHLYKKSEGDTDSLTNLATSIGVATINGCDSAMCLDAWNICSLSKQSMKMAKTGFWGSIGLIDTIDFFNKFNEIRDLKSDLDLNLCTPEERVIFNHEIRLCYLNIAKATSSVAMAAISLTSLLYASLAQGFLFSPVVFLSLASAWLVLSYTTYFYERMIDRWEG